MLFNFLSMPSAIVLEIFKINKIEVMIGPSIIREILIRACFIFSIFITNFIIFHFLIIENLKRCLFVFKRLWRQMRSPILIMNYSPGCRNSTISIICKLLISYSWSSKISYLCNPTTISSM